MTIINSLIDTDFNKLTMAQAVYHQYPVTIVRYIFSCRSNQKITHLHEINQELDHLCSLRFAEEELDYLSSISFFKPDFIEYLRFVQLNRNYIKTYLDKDMNLQIEIEGPWIATIFFEVPILAIINEVYSKHQNSANSEKIIAQGKKLLSKKIEYLTGHLKTGQITGFKFAEIGTSCRYSYEWQDFLIDRLRSKFRPYLFVGTSNVYFAKKYELKPIGTMSYEWVQAHQQLNFPIIDSQKAAFDVWAKEYRGELGIALSDVLGFKTFLNDFDLYFAKLFDGCMHNSGDPVSWCVKLVEHYDKLGVDPKTKHAVFADGITFQKAIEIHETLGDMINISFAIDSNLTNDAGVEPLDIVFDMVVCNGRPVVKMPDNDKKVVCENPRFLARVKKKLNI
jgi:nicotinate phosphoribosyltransferase